VIEIFFELVGELLSLVIDLVVSLFQSGGDFSSRNPKDRE
jgi:hypothetical protein